MTPTRQALSQAHPAKTNVLSVGLINVLILIVSLQIWLLSASLNTSLGGHANIAWTAFYGSLALFIAGTVALRYLPLPIRLPEVVKRVEPFVNAALAWRTLGISAVSLALAFGVWFMWSAIAVKLNDAGFGLSKNQLFWLTATPVILGSLLRIRMASLSLVLAAGSAMRQSRCSCFCLPSEPASPCKIQRHLIGCCFSGLR
jgi:Family of unknown function (DUF6755)